MRVNGTFRFVSEFFISRARFSIATRSLAAILVCLSSHARSQQVPDEGFDPPVARPAYASGTGPVVGIDEARVNFHTADGGYAPFAKLLRKDGYRVQPFSSKFSTESLKDVQVLVIANALTEENRKRWALPAVSAFSDSEIEAVETWVKEGGALLLIADHMPFPGAAAKLAERFGVLFQNGFAFAHDQPDAPIRCSIVKHPIFAGRNAKERVPFVQPGMGQAFTLLPGGKARPLLVYEGEMTLRLPVVSWEFSETTPRIRADGMLLGAVATPGRGRVALMGEAAMLTAQLWGPERKPAGMNGPDAKHNAQFVLNMLHWLTKLLPAE